MFKVMRTGKRKSKMWKRMITKVTFVGDGFTRKPPKYERFIRPRALRFKKAHVTHPELKVTTNMHQSLLPVMGLSLSLCVASVAHFLFVSLFLLNFLPFQVTFCLDIIGVKKNPQSPLYTQLGVMTKGTVIEVNVSDLGLVTTTGKIVWGKYAQITNTPENDGCVNAVLLV